MSNTRPINEPAVDVPAVFRFEHATRRALLRKGPGVETSMAFVASRSDAFGRRACSRGAIRGAIFALWLAVGQVHADPREAALVLDVNTGRVLHESNADDPRFPASLTKMMTLYMLFGEIDAGRMTYATRISISEHAAGQAPSRLGLDPGKEITAINAIKALITKSANDIAAAVAEHIGGTETQFARKMTERARQIGMTRTTFRNASGLPHADQVTTARDMMTLALRLFDDHQKHWSLFATRFFVYAGKVYRNHNAMLGMYVGADGIKTGYIRASGFNIVTSVRRGSKHVMVAVFGGATAATRNLIARNLLDRALMRASPQRTRWPAPMFVVQAMPDDRRITRHPELGQTPGSGRRAAVPTASSAVRLSPVMAERRHPPRSADVADVTSELGAQDRDALTVLVEQAASSGVMASSVTSASPGEFHLQVGAFGTAGEAERKLSATRALSGNLLTRYNAATVPVQKDNRLLFRARFIGFDAASAKSICNSLRQHKVDCLVMRAE